MTASCRAVSIRLIQCRPLNQMNPKTIRKATMPAIELVDVGQDQLHPAAGLLGFLGEDQNLHEKGHGWILR